jgi:hypothetical protein
MVTDLPMFPLSIVLFPGAVLPLHVFEPRYRVMLERCIEGDGRFGITMIARGSEVGGGDDRVTVGTVAEIQGVDTLPDGRSLMVVEGRQRFRVLDWLPEDPYPRATVEWLAEEATGADSDPELNAALVAVRRARALLSELRDVPALPAQVPADPDTRGWWLCEQAPIDLLDRQHLLECEDTADRLRLLASLMDPLADDLGRLLAEG